MYIDSKDIKVYPAVFRGTTTIEQSSSSAQFVFDPESRLMTEESLIRAYNLLARKNNACFVVNSSISAGDKLEFVINGYYFIIRNFQNYFGDVTTYYAKINKYHRNGTWDLNDSVNIHYVSETLYPIDPSSINTKFLDATVGNAAQSSFVGLEIVKEADLPSNHSDYFKILEKTDASSYTIPSESQLIFTYEDVYGGNEEGENKPLSKFLDTKSIKTNKLYPADSEYENSILTDGFFLEGTTPKIRFGSFNPTVVNVELNNTEGLYASIGNRNCFTGTNNQVFQSNNWSDNDAAIRLYGSDGLYAQGSAFINENLRVANKAWIQGEAHLDGYVRIGDTLVCNGDATFNKTIDIRESMFVNSNIYSNEHIEIICTSVLSDVSSLPSGIKFVNIHDNNGPFITKGNITNISPSIPLSLENLDPNTDAVSLINDAGMTPGGHYDFQYVSFNPNQNRFEIGQRKLLLGNYNEAELYDRLIVPAYFERKDTLQTGDNYRKELHIGFEGGETNTAISLHTTKILSSLANCKLELEGSNSCINLPNSGGYINVTQGYVQAQYFNALSDKRLKENLIEFKSSRSILDLPIYKYDFKEGAKNQIGCLAQDLQEICPELVHEDENGYLSIQENKLVYLLLDEVKQLKQEVEELRKEVKKF